ncbi:MAG: vWA domain-containing protein, partial [Polyangiales bacterium]
MSFRDVHVLWALACLPLAWLAAWHAQRRRQQARAHFSALGFWASTAPPGLRRIGVLLAWSVAWALLVLAAAGPRFGTEPRKLKVRGVDVVWLLDVSKSMWADDVKPSRLARAKAEMRQWLSASAGHRVGVVAFAGQAVTFPLTMDLEAVRLFIEELGPQDMPVGGTDFA